MSKSTDMDTSWGTDVPISLPVPSPYPILVTMGPMGFTNYGLNHNLSKGDLEKFVPTYMPKITKSNNV